MIRGLCGKLAKVEEVVTGQDGHSRGAVIRVPGRNRSRLLRRPIQRLYPLETGHNEESERDNSKDDATVTGPEGVQPSATTSDSGVRIRPKRAAAIAAADRVKACTVYESQ